MTCTHSIASTAEGGCFLCPPPKPLLPPPKPPREPGGAVAKALKLKHAIKVAKCRKRLSVFLREGWHVLEPGTKLDWSWHIEALCDHIQVMFENWARMREDHTFDPGVPQNVIFNVPPGTLKSRILSVYAPAWAWLRWPDFRLLALSSNPVVADRDADYSRQVLMSDWYQEWFKPEWEIERDGIRYFTNSAGGHRVTRGLNAKVTGLRGDAIIVDDPNDVKEVSDVKLTAVANHWRGAVSRVNDERTAFRIMIQQRTHAMDLTGVILDTLERKGPNPDWAHVVIPLERESDDTPCITCKVPHPVTFTGWRDPRGVNEVLQPERNTPKVVARMKRELGSYGAAGQLQQRPSPAGGGQFKKAWWRSYDELEKTSSGRPKLDQCVISVDANFKEGGTSRAAIGVIGGKGAKRFVMHAWAKSVDYPALKKELKSVAARFPYYTKILIEDKANGSALIAELGKDLRAVIGVNPEGGKQTRASAMAPAVEAGDVYLPRHAEWRDDFIEEHAQFPVGRFDDFVDMLSQAMADMQEMSALDRLRAMAKM